MQTAEGFILTPGGTGKEIRSLGLSEKIKPSGSCCSQEVARNEMDTFFSIISQLRILEDLTCQFIIYIYEFRTVGSSEEIWVYKCARYYCYYDMDSLTKKSFCCFTNI